MQIRLPQALVEQARAFADGTREPAEPRNAATVVLMRPSDRGPELYLLSRQTTMAFAGGMCVFPGGGVDPRDFDHEIAWEGPSPKEWAARLGTDEDLARALVCAAVRETFEESGVLLAGPAPHEVIADTTGPDWEADRQALEARELAFTDFLDRRELVLRTDLLGAWSAWLTPIFEPRRYRTWFFVAHLPEGQRTRDVSTESSSVTWLPAIDAVEQVEDGKINMMPPTYVTCLELTPYDGPDAVLAASREREIELFMPEVVEKDGDVTLSRPPAVEGLLAERARVRAERS